MLNNLASLGKRIRNTRKIQQLRQDDLANMAGISRSTLNEIEKGSPVVNISNYMATLWALGIMADILANALEETDRQLFSE